MASSPRRCSRMTPMVVWIDMSWCKHCKLFARVGISITSTLQMLTTRPSKKIMWQGSISGIFWICTFNKNCKYSSWITNFKNLPIQLAQGAASEGGIDLGSKGSREVNRCRRWIVNTTSHFDIIWPFPQFILVNAYVYWTNWYIMFNVYFRMYASDLWLLMYRMTRMMSEVLQRLIGSLSHRILSINSICAQCRM